MRRDDEFILDKIEKVTLTFPFKDYISVDSALSALTIVKAVKNIVGGFTGRLLDIGSGPMDKTAIFSLCGFECYAVDDLSDPWHRKEDNVNIIKEFASRMGINFYLQKDNDYTINFDKNSFDIVMANGVIEHLHESPRDFLNTAFEFVKTNGIVVVTMPNSVNLRKRLSVLWGKTNYPEIRGFFHSYGQWRGHVREYTLDETIFILTETGGEIVFANTCHANIHRKISNAFMRKMYELLTAIVPTLRDRIIVIARKPPGWAPKEFKEEEFWRTIGKNVPRGVIPSDYR